MTVFRPAVPRDTQGVMRLFAIAARVVCQEPDSFDQVDRQLAATRSQLVPPEDSAAKECDRLWRVFARVVQVPKATLLQEAGRAFYRDLDSIGQRLDLPPLDEWENLPCGIDEPGAAAARATADPGHGETLAWVRQQARDLAQPLVAKEPFPANHGLRLLASLEVSERGKLFDQLVGKGLMGRAEVNLLSRCLIKGAQIVPEDAALVDVLQRLGRWLAQS